jgi:hypothetical protein
VITYRAEFGKWFKFYRYTIYVINGDVIVHNLRELSIALRNLYVPRRLVRVALSQIKDGSHTCVYGGKWGKDLVEVVRI